MASEVKRYDCGVVLLRDGNVTADVQHAMFQRNDGGWVSYSDYAALKALESENERLRVLLQQWRKERGHAGHHEGHLAGSGAYFDDRCDLCKRTDAALAPVAQPSAEGTEAGQ